MHLCAQLRQFRGEKKQLYYNGNIYIYLQTYINLYQVL